MLLLNVRVGECVIIQTPEGEVVLTVCDSGERWSKLGFAGPETIRIWREKVLRGPRRQPVDNVPTGGVDGSVVGG